MKVKAKVRTFIFAVLMCMPIIADIIALPFMPKTIPIHFASNGIPDRMGNRIESLFVASMSLIIGITFIIFSIIANKNEKDGTNNANALYITGISMLLLYNAVFAYFLKIVFCGTASNTTANFLRIVIGAIGIILVVFGNISPTLRRNSIIGFRIPQSMKNDEVWKKSQHFSGICSIAAGILIALSAIFAPGNFCIVVSAIIMLVFIVICSIYALIISKNTADEQ